MTRHSLTQLLAGIFAAVALAACGGNDSNAVAATPAASAAPAATAQAAPADTAAAPAKPTAASTQPASTPRVVVDPAAIAAGDAQFQALGDPARTFDEMVGRDR